MHVDFEPIFRRFNFAKDDFLRGGIVLNDEMIPFAQFAALAHFLRDDDLASGGQGCGHASKYYLLFKHGQFRITVRDFSCRRVGTYWA